MGNYTRHNITIITDNTIFIVCDVLWCSTEDNVTYSLLHYLLCSFFFFRLHFNDLVYLRPINHCHFLTFKVLTMGNLHKDVFSTFQKLQNLESFDLLLINQIMMKMTPKLSWTFPAQWIGSGPALCAWWYQYCGNSQFIINCFQATQKQRRNIDNGRVMVAVSPRQWGPQTLILKHLNTIWSGMKYGAYILLWILMILLTHKISFYLLATFVRIIRALFSGFKWISNDGQDPCWQDSWPW